MKVIAFDGICLGDGPVTGVGRSFLNALTAYANRRDAECILLLPKGVKTTPIASVRVVDAPRGAIRRQQQLPRLLKSVDASLLHSSVASIPLRAACPTIATAHDLPWLHPEIGEAHRPWRQFAIKRALRSASRILSPSTMTSHDVASLLGQRRPPIDLVMHGTELGTKPTSATTAARNGPFLVLGDNRPRKNLERLRAAHQSAKTQCKDLPPLQFVGPPDHYIKESDKHDLLKTCRALIHVSLFEGFGMPVLEGLANGAPVLCSDLAPHREIASDAALFVSPHNTSSMAEALLQIHTETAQRQRLALAGYDRARRLTPEATAARWSSIHQSLLS